jgi:hypothetical protein
LWHWFVLLIGGWIVIIGLLLEDIPDWRWFQWSKDDSRRHIIGRIAIYVIVLGILIESVQTVLLDVEAANARLETTKLEQQISETRTNLTNIDPLNRPISDISAVVSVKLAGTNFVESPLWGSPAVASLSLNEGNIIMNNPGLGDLRILIANKDDVSPVDYAYLIPREYARGYVLHFHPDVRFVTSVPAFRADPTNAKWVIDKVKALQIDAKFIPHDAELLGGNVEIIINGNVRLDFDILPQKAFPPPTGLSANPGDSGFTMIATNATLKTLPSWMRW